ncbi:MAG: hypothetical protein KDA24_03170, partial [Deltaproteobacteria bacterium]|nr:hypothetical protein [Deltaproteobacteria bacterium]
MHTMRLTAGAASPSSFVRPLRVLILMAFLALATGCPTTPADDDDSVSDDDDATGDDDDATGDDDDATGDDDDATG